MKRVCLVVITFLFLVTASAFAGGDQNTQQHDGQKGKGSTNQERVNK